MASHNPAERDMRFVNDDGGRAAAGFRGNAGDCVARAVAIASGRPYAEVYAALAQGTGAQRSSKHTPKRGRTARSGINVKRKWFKDFMHALGFEWVPTMRIGSGCTVHLSAGELPLGRLVVSVSKHYTAVLDGVIHDTDDPQRETVWYGAYDPKTKRNTIASVQRRCVYGYWLFRGEGSHA